ncbi:CBS domain-containing protein [Streptomyces venezuelae]|uniref:CBS domain-containing protein n=1 Tax=Streptomyces gardneri TaxID=66892 RepID=UPI0006BCD4AB|nr:CBS domain-containing protein [Streptomyces gardneri]ALO06462.1 CBS domain-containing protein [Streptomyces venezuelae]WRK35163.1 CBS domain-containing protein [Streptomyces venezuelae]CUM43270.1 Inosine-5'-monophosphate dehydrogenase [Streptomyces venezuelae]
MRSVPVTRYTVSDVMTHTAVAIGRDAPYKEIVALLDQWKVSALPVLEGEGRVVGVVSEADLLPKEEFRLDTPRPGEFGEAAKAGALRAGEIMSSPAVTVHADATLAEAARIMATRRVKRLPVVNDIGMLEGVVSRSDLLKVFLRSDGEIEEEIRRSVLGKSAAPAELDVSVSEGVATLRGVIADRSLVPLLARAVRAVEGVVDVRLDLDAPADAS